MAGRITILDETDGLEVALSLDVVDSETYSGTAKVTRHPVEFGVAIADHIQPDPRPFEWKGSASAYPLDASGAKDEDRLRILLETLEKLRLASRLYTVVTPFAIYEHTHLTSYSASHSASNGTNVFDVSLKVEQLEVVTGQRVKVPPRAPDNTKGKVNDGKQVTTPASTEAKRKSIFARLADGNLNVFGTRTEQ